MCPASPQSMTRCATLIRSRNVRLVVNIGDLIHWTAVHSHPQLDMRMLSQRSADLERTSHRLFRTLEEKKRHPIASRHSDEFAACFRHAKRFSSVHDLVQFLQQ